jgi:hypothetical protein
MRYWLVQETAVLQQLASDIETGNPRLARLMWNTPDKSRGCLAHFIGMQHEACRETPHPGMTWWRGTIPGVSRVIRAWDSGSRKFAAEFLAMLKTELSYRCADGPRILGGPESLDAVRGVVRAVPAGWPPRSTAEPCPGTVTAA